MNEIVVWSWSLDDRRLQGGGAARVLSEAERQRALRLIDERHRRRFLAGRIGLREILGAHTGEAPSALSFAENAFGKPRLVGRSLHFSLSHSGGQAVLAICDDAPVGIDIECVRDLEHDAIAARHFHPNEAAWIESRPSEEERRIAFFQAWTLKEAVVKAAGMGMSLPFSEFEISLSETPPRVVAAPPGTPLQWRLRLLGAPAGYLCALAAPGARDVAVTQHSY